MFLKTSSQFMGLFIFSYLDGLVFECDRIFLFG
ncbi:hypothetical protein CRC_03201 [Cylindrospermopsis raciborskii CS-505]|nr:hypothetical protein CRC_03201 [Cylindrospermopsis raciborskii CS-505]